MLTATVYPLRITEWEVHSRTAPFFASEKQRNLMKKVLLRFKAVGGLHFYKKIHAHTD